MNIGSQKPYNYYNYTINHNANNINNHSKASTNSAKKPTLLEDNHHSKNDKNEKIAPAMTKISYIPKPIQSNLMVNYKSNYSSNYNSNNNQIHNDKNDENNNNYKNPNNQQKYVNKMSPYTEIIYNKENEHKDPYHSSTTSI